MKSFLFLVFVVTAALYESFSKPFLIILAIPMALAGVFLSFYFFDANFSRGGYALLLLLGGIVVNNSIVLVDRMGLAVKQRAESKLLPAIIEFALERVCPILTTSLLAIASLLPMIFCAEKAVFGMG